MSKRHEAITRIAARTMDGADTLEVALTLAEAGAAFFPCAVNKTPHISGWQKLDAVDASQALAWHGQWPDMIMKLPKKLLAEAHEIFTPINFDLGQPAKEDIQEAQKNSR